MNLNKYIAAAFLPLIFGTALPAVASNFIIPHSPRNNTIIDTDVVPQRIPSAAQPDNALFTKGKGALMLVVIDGKQTQYVKTISNILKNMHVRNRVVLKVEHADSKRAKKIGTLPAIGMTNVGYTLKGVQSEAAIRSFVSAGLGITPASQTKQ